MLVRQATLDDARQIAALFTAQITIWQRLNAHGHVEDLPYDALTIYERWLHGGPWMTLETGSIWLSYLLKGNGYAYVLETDGKVLAYAEAFDNREAPPMKNHLHLARMLVDDGCGDDAHHQLAEAVLRDARPFGRLSVAYPEYDRQQATYYRKYFGANETLRLTRYALPAQIGQSFYKTHDYDETAASAVAGWQMSVGRWTSPRALWETEWVEHWKAIPQIIERSKQRQYINASGHEAIVCYHQQLYNARNADVYCWSPRGLSGQLVVAIRDLGHRSGYRSLIFAVPQSSAKLLPPESTADPHQQVIATVNV